MKRLAGVALACLIATPAWAQDQERDYCPQRPGLGSEPCTIDARHISVEMGAVSWQRDASGGDRTDTVTLGDTLVRIGLGRSTDLGVEWVPYTRERDRSGGIVSTSSGVGDVTVALKQNLVHPDGSDFSIAITPYVSLPVGAGPGTAGDWAAGAVIPIAYDLGHGLGLASTTQLGAAVDADGHGRHFLASEVVGLGIALNSALSLTLEGQLLRDEDPAGATTQAYTSASLAWKPSRKLQFDLGAVAGLNANSPDLQLYFGVSRLF